MNAFQPSWEPSRTTRELIIKKYDWKILRGMLLFPKTEALRARLALEAQRIIAARQQEPVSIWNILAPAALAFGGIRSEFSHVKPDGEAEILDGPLSSKSDQDVIEDRLRDCLRIGTEYSIIARQRLRDMISSQRAVT